MDSREPPGCSRRHKPFEPSTSDVPANLLHAAADAAGAAGARVADADARLAAAAVTDAAAGTFAAAVGANRGR